MMDGENGMDDGERKSVGSGRFLSNGHDNSRLQSALGNVNNHSGGSMAMTMPLWAEVRHVLRH